jgi:hypothetical protein
MGSLDICASRGWYIFYDGYFAVEGISVWDRAYSESMFPFVGTETDNKT